MKIGVLGASGKMGRAVIKTLIEYEALNRCVLSGGSVRRGSSFEGADLGILAGLEPKGMFATADAEGLIRNSDVLIDFTSPDSSMEFANLCAFYDKKIVIGSTGTNEEHQNLLRGFAQKAVIFYAANTSLGINILTKLVAVAAKLLDDEFDVEISEIHHKLKKDAPSGTALLLANTVRNARDKNAELKFSYAEDYGARKQGSIGVASMRAGDVIGEHTVMFAGKGERIELTHRASDRALFAVGAVKAAIWLNEQKPGKVYGMNDFLS